MSIFTDTKFKERIKRMSLRLIINQPLNSGECQRTTSWKVIVRSSCFSVCLLVDLFICLSAELHKNKFIASNKT